ncbi:MAG: oxaloacetate decarboxylase [Bacteroidales bacterium]|nr:oxaloacetate decarboxylase [Bacteroidales bacterium]
MSPVPADVRKLFYKVKKAQGTDITRCFCGLNDPRNIIDSIKYSKEAGMIAQATLSLTVSKVHTVEYYCKLADELIANGADEICLKDMAGIGRPVSLGKIVKHIKTKYPHILVQYHGQTGPGFTPASILEVCNNGCDIIDVGMEPLSWGTGHADVIMVQEMLKDAGFKVPEINMTAYMKARTLTQEFMDDFLGYFIPESNRRLQSLLIAPGLPGGMMGSLMNDLKDNLSAINKSLVKKGQSEITTDDLLIKLFDEVAYVWPRVGYPPLVTPFSQYVKNLAMFNIMQVAKGQERWTMIADNIWDMILGKAGRLPGEVAPEIKELAAKQNRQFYTGNPQDLYPNKLDEFRKEMQEKGWEVGQDEEELFELAMHPEQYRALKSGKAKADFEKELAEEKAKVAKSSTPATSSETFEPKTLNLDVNGEKFVVHVSYGAGASTSATAPAASASQATSAPVSGDVKSVAAPISGKFFKTKDSSETALKIGDSVKNGQIIGYIEAMKVFNAIAADCDGKIVEFCFNSGDDIEEDDIIIRVQ